MPTHEQQSVLANTQVKLGLEGKAGARIEVADSADEDYEPQYALGDVYDPDWNIDPLVGANEDQTIRIEDGTGGTFTITYGGQTTAAIPFDSDADTVAQALADLSNVTPGDIRVTKTGTTDDHTYTLAYGGQLARTDVAQVTVDSTNVTGTEVVTIATTQAGSAS
jgi:hypothetical protein